MFTGIIEHIGTITQLNANNGGRVFFIDVGWLREGALIGDSIAVDGVCLTVEHWQGNIGRFVLSGETLQKTRFSTAKPGQRVNLERALCVGDRLGGHMVSGHVDGVGRILERVKEGDCERFVIQLPEEVLVVEKGSLSVDGISLTTWDCRGQRCSIAVIPHTLAVTTLGQRRVGDLVHLEQDVVGRWISRLMPGAMTTLAEIPAAIPAERPNAALT